MALWGRDLYAVVFAASFLFFGTMFFVAWGVSAYAFRRVWPRFMVQEKADWASRVNSQIHAFIVVPGFLATLATTDYDYSTWYNDAGNIVPSSVIMSISLGYFSFDFLVLLYYRVPLWVVFVFHHIFASVPYFTYVFHPCEAGNLVLSGFLLVEFATMFLNFQTWMEKLGHAKTHRFTIMFYCTYVSWFLTRVLLPVFLLYVVWNIFLSDTTADRNLQSCLIPGLVCAHIITLFCWVVFFFVLTPEVLERWRETPETLEARLLEARRRRRNIVVEQVSRANTPSGQSATGSVRRMSRQGSGVLSPDATTSGRTSTTLPGGGGELSAGAQMHEPIEFELEAGQHPERERGAPADVDLEEEDDLAVNGPLGVDLNEGFLNYDMLVQTMLADNPYRTRPAGRPDLTDLSLEDIRRDGISMERRTTAYGTTTMRL